MTKNTNYAHFEEWIAAWRRNNAAAEIQDDNLIGLYMATYPGRTGPLVVELVELARVWSREQEIVKEIRAVNDSGTLPADRPLGDN